MSQGQMHNEFPGQVFDLTAADPNIAREQLFNDLLGAIVPHEKSRANKDHHVIAQRAPSGSQTFELLSGVNPFVRAAFAVQECFVGAKAAQMKGAQGSAPRLENFQPSSAIRTNGLSRSKRQVRLSSKQTGNRNLLRQLFSTVLKGVQRPEFDVQRVFFRSYSSKKAATL